MLGLLACKDPSGFAPGDDPKPDPPEPPVPVYPLEGESTEEYGYPQDVVFQWQPVAGAFFYEIEVYTDSVLNPGNQYGAVGSITETQAGVGFHTYGTYYWHVRAGSPNWKWYTDWSELISFHLPNPTR